MERKQKIILMHLDGVSNREIASKMHMSKDTVNKYVNEYDEQKRKVLELNREVDPNELIAAIIQEPSYNTENREARKITEAAIMEIKECLELNKRRAANGMSKQQMLKKDIYNYLKSKGFDISYSTVKRTINKITGNEKEAYIRQEYGPGEICEFDWGTVKLNINNSGYKAYQMAVFTSANSNYRYAKLYEKQDTVAFQESHADFLWHCKGTFSEFVYDNMRVAIRRFVGLTEKEPTTALLEMSIYYGFKFRFTNIRKGNEKGHVERSVDVVRNNVFCLPGSDQFTSLEAANIYLLNQCTEMNRCKISNGTIPAEVFKTEQKHMLPCPPKFECCVRTDNRVDKYATVVVNQSHYSVPDKLVGKMVAVKMYTDTISIFYEGNMVAKHSRSHKRSEWVIDIMHYLRTLAKKPGALKRSSALLQADTQIKKLYEQYYSSDSKTFLQVLEIIKEHGYETVAAAIERVRKVTPSDISFAKVKTICDHMRENTSFSSSNIIYIPDRLTELNKKTLSGYDKLFNTKEGVKQGWGKEGQGWGKEGGEALEN